MKLSPSQSEALSLIAEGRYFPTLVREEDGWHARWRAIGAENHWVDGYVRSAVTTTLTEDAEDQKHETLHDAWLMALRSRTGLVVWDDAECAGFADELERWSGSASEDGQVRKAVVFSLVTEGKAFRLECDVPWERRCLQALGNAAYVFSPLVGLRTDGVAKASRRQDSSRTLHHLIVELSPADAERFIQHGARDLANLGYTVKGVDLSVEVTAEAEVNEDRHVDFKVRVAGEVVTAAEIRFLLEQGSTLVFFRNRWINVDRNILKEALRALERGKIPDSAALGFALGIGHVGRLEFAEAKTHGWLRGLVNQLQARGELSDSVHAPLALEGFCGKLRDYQRRGVEWMRFLTGHGFGALLADDMGLGKTIQTIAWLVDCRLKSPAIVVAPLTLLANWRHEIARFAPRLRVYVHQGDGRHLASGFHLAVTEADVVLTSYNLLVREYSQFSEIEWGAMVLDEAQAIKNHDTQISRAVRALTPKLRVALTGTPIENSVADVWSLQEFLNPGFLGERREFAERFVKPITANRESVAAKRLRHALEPFVMRRLKSEPAIAAELGEKHEIREYCALSAIQRREYESALSEFRTTEHDHGEIFALITRLKLICDGVGKLERLIELVENIFENGESVLIFSQYAKVGDWLQKELAKKFGREFPFLHGGLSAAQRERAVAAFQSSPRPEAFVLSLKAGGFGLNLTKATHVIHFDRWWNPAVESQATDRAHRIGQERAVFVHLFICTGTIEERVDELLQQKSQVAGSVITDAEWRELLETTEERK